MPKLDFLNEKKVATHLQPTFNLYFANNNALNGCISVVTSFRL